MFQRLFATQIKYHVTDRFVCFSFEQAQPKKTFSTTLGFPNDISNTVNAIRMTRTTSFGFGKRQYVASTAEEHAGKGKGDFTSPAPNDGNGEGDVNAEAGPSKGWGKDPEIIRQSTSNTSFECLASR